MASQNTYIYYRPQWTCGQFNKDVHAAIYYNLIEGMAYFFEDYAADVIGVILSLGRGGSISLDNLSDTTGIGTDSLMAFAKELCELNLLTTVEPDEEYIDKVREVKKHKSTGISHHQPYTESKATDDYPVELNDAELAYKEKVGGIVSVMFELTYLCSEKCIHCYNIGATRNDKEKSHRGVLQQISLEDYQRIIDELHTEGVIKVCLSGGDPFSNPNVWSILDYLYQKDIAVDIFTNGLSILGKEKRVARYYPRLVGISLYSGIASDHDKITRVKGSWNKTMTVIENLHNLSVPIILKCCVMRPNLKSYYTVSNVGKPYNIPIQFELNVTDSVDGDKCVSHYLRLSPEQLEIVLRDPNSVMYVGKELSNYGGIAIEMEKNACMAGYSAFCISPNGDLMPCCAFHMAFGNLKEQHLKDILSNSYTLHWWRQLKVKDYEECGQHDYCAYCNLCAGLNYSENGTPLKAAENNCYMAKVRYNLAQRMLKTGYDPLNGITLEERLNKLDDVYLPDIERTYSSIKRY